ncbi:M16 family metallopeptidase [Pseudomonas donghuensis]|uniref:M16 family metallopeptidase n=1 Tax=Pseudomonas donghuensis TaxID=1163398 RepID=UPI0020C419D6|nr:pitrilysin family protein [Pseudomonas donghuensis]MCP6696809.1 insulinase family protein [Pseudomonas donghuensis]
MNKLKRYLLPALLVMASATSHAQSQSAPLELESLKTTGTLAINPQLPIESWQTPQGSKVLFVRNNQLPMFDLQVVFAAGSARDDGAAGLAQLTLSMLDEGTVERDALQIAEDFDEVGAIFNKQALRDSAAVTLRSLSSQEQRSKAVGLLAEVLGKPQLAEDKLPQIKDQLTSLLTQRQQYATYKAHDLLYQHAFANHPYASNSIGTVQAIESLTIADVRAFHQSAFSAGNALITLVGDLSLEQAEAIASHISAALPQGPALWPLPVPASFEPEIYHLEHPGTQALLLFAIPGINARDPDAPALTLANLILGGPGATSRLFNELRSQRGLTYAASSRLIQHPASGIWTFTTQVQARYRDATMALLEQLLTDYAVQGPTAQEFEDAKQKLRGNYLLGSVSNQQISDILRFSGFNQLPLDSRQAFLKKVQALTLDQLKVALKNHLKLDKLVQISVGPTVEQDALPESKPATG